MNNIGLLVPYFVTNTIILCNIGNYNTLDSWLYYASVTNLMGSVVSFAFASILLVLNDAFAYLNCLTGPDNAEMFFSKAINYTISEMGVFLTAGTIFMIAYLPIRIYKLRTKYVNVRKKKRD